MIAVTRTAKPRILTKKETAWLNKYLNATTKKAKTLAESKYRHQEIKTALVAMFNGKCAYCESKITHIDYGHIEHFKPKSTFPNETFVWNNFLLACGICNGAEHKGNHFPDAGSGGPFVNPCDDNPETHFEFVYDEQAEIATVVGLTDRGRTTVQFLGLNRTDLRTYRSSQVRKLYCIASFAATDAEAREILDEAVLSHSEYSAFAKALVAD